MKGHQSSDSGEQFNEREKQSQAFPAPTLSTSIHAGVRELSNGLKHMLQLTQRLAQGLELKWI